MDRQAELRAERDALEAELLALERDIEGQGHGAAVSAELTQRVEDLLGRLKLVNKEQSALGSLASK